MRVKLLGGLWICLLAVAAALLVAPGGALAQRSGAPGVSAGSAIVVDARDGHVIYRKAANTRRPIASATKLMTALLSMEHLSLRRRLRAAPYQAAPAESQINLAPGERMSVADLLRALLLESANDAAVTLARGASGSVDRFVRMMNERARELGLGHTGFANPVGLDEAGNFSSARDLAALTSVVLRREFLADTVDMASARLLTGSHPRIVDNRNDLVARVPWIEGVKTGHTSQAGYVLVGAGTRNGARLVSVVLGTPSEAARDADTLALLDYGLGLYRRVAPLRRGRSVADAKVAFFGDRKVAIEPRRTVAVSVRRGERVSTRIDAPGEIDGPVAAGAQVGQASVFVDGRRVRTVPLVTADAVPKAGFARKVAHWLVRPLTLVALLAVALMVLGRRQRRLAAEDAARRRRRQAARVD
jgi:serine-type D-Ala-D-Ala carboxypeptidase (penicillin-binding protein 5/6)